MPAKPGAEQARIVEALGLETRVSELAGPLLHLAAPAWETLRKLSLLNKALPCLLLQRGNLRVARNGCLDEGGEADLMAPDFPD